MIVIWPYQVDHQTGRKGTVGASASLSTGATRPSRRTSRWATASSRTTAGAALAGAHSKWRAWTLPGNNILVMVKVATAAHRAGRHEIDDRLARRPVARDPMALEPRRSVVLLPSHALDFRVSLACARARRRRRCRRRRPEKDARTRVQDPSRLLEQTVWRQHIPHCSG